MTQATLWCDSDRPAFEKAINAVYIGRSDRPEWLVELTPWHQLEDIQKVDFGMGALRFLMVGVLKNRQSRLTVQKPARWSRSGRRPPWRGEWDD